MNDREKLLELIRLHDEAFDHAMKFEGCHKSSEGAVSLHFTNRFDEERDEVPLTVKGVEVYAYVLGPNRSHWFDSVDDALDAMRLWHKAEMEHDYSEDMA